MVVYKTEGKRLGVKVLIVASTTMEVLLHSLLSRQRQSEFVVMLFSSMRKARGLKAHIKNLSSLRNEIMPFHLDVIHAH